MSELQTEEASATTDIINQDIAQVDTGTVENGPELATGGNEDSDTINQDAVQKRIDKATHKFREAERATKTVSQERDDLQAKLNAIEANKPAPTVSEMPDRFEATDEEWRTAELKRDNELLEVALHKAAQEDKQAASQAAITKQNEAREAEGQRIGQDFSKRADGFGISRENLQKASEVVLNYGVNTDVIMHIASIDNGPLIVQYLATNPTELGDLADMNPMQAAVHVSNVLSEKAAVMKPKTSNAPDPVVPLGGNGVDPSLNKHPAFVGGKYS
ncbi:MAG: hypothetical protein JKY50_00805 [Oleispira sp.]|nr:hypothetical protein [Oleispira sp.]